MEPVHVHAVIRLEIDAPMPYWDRTRYDPDLQRARDALTASSFDTSWTHGTGLDLRSAFDLAHEELADLIIRPDS